jgi:hypothetical protein
MENKDRMICRMNVLAHATALFCAGKSQDVLKTAELLEKWVWRDIESEEVKNKGGTQHLCSECHVEVSQKVKQYSIEKFKMILCFDCQSKKRAK